MSYTKNQHILSQWILRNFRSDDTATVSKNKKRVWVHTVYFDKSIGTVAQDRSFPISSVGIKKNCFLLVDGQSGEKFDIENELSIYEKKTSKLFDSIIKEHNFKQLLNVNYHDCPLEMILNYMIIQSILNFHNPQNKIEGKEEYFENLIQGLINDFDNVKNQINNPPSNLSHLMQGDIYKKVKRTANSSSSKEEICKTLFALFMILESEGLPSLVNFLPTIRNKLFEGIYIEAIYHTGYDFNSIKPRPVFTISPNIMCHDFENGSLDLPLSHNLAIYFSIGKRKYYNDKLNIFSVNPDKLLCEKSDKINIYKVSHDYIDQRTSTVNIININNSKTIYTPHCLQDVEDYLELQKENKEFYYNPNEPIFLGN